MLCKFPFTSWRETGTAYTSGGNKRSCKLRNRFTIRLGWPSFPIILRGLALIAVWCFTERDRTMRCITNGRLTSYICSRHSGGDGCSRIYAGTHASTAACQLSGGLATASGDGEPARL